MKKPNLHASTIAPIFLLLLCGSLARDTSVEDTATLPHFTQTDVYIPSNIRPDTSFLESESRSQKKKKRRKFEDGAHPGVKSIVVKYGDDIDSISMTYLESDSTENHGGSGGSQELTVDLDQGEGIVRVHGWEHKMSKLYGIQELDFLTNSNRTFTVESRRHKHKYGKEFTYNAPPNHILGGIYGIANNHVLTLGVHWVTKGSRKKKIPNPDMMEIPDSPFTVVKKSLSQEEHSLLAKQLGYELATVKGPPSENTIGSFLQSNFSASPEYLELEVNTGFWIGGKRKRGMIFIYQDGGKLRFTDWHRFEPSNSGGDENCIEITKRSKKWAWNDAKCSVEKFAIYLR